MTEKWKIAQKSTQNAQNAARKIRSLKLPAKIESVLYKAPKQLADLGKRDGLGQIP
jgi:hypothetical protein